MLFIAIYLFIGFILAGLIDYITRKRNTNVLTPLELVIAILGWPIFLGIRIFSKE